MTELSEKKERKSQNILIIENDDDLVELLEELFSYEGYQVRCYKDTNDIFSLMEDFKPDIVLVDYLLPGINGGELCAQLKRDPSTKHIPVVIFSAYSQVLLSLGSYGCNAFISKPFELSSLLNQINKCLENPSKIFTEKEFDKKTSASAGVNE
ncbi:response regulator [Pedobacter panaciterrae]|jgi:Response regulator containing CheY-like receiver, AAA-type ATPase, and DNA-binding domains|uniref:Response regulator n=1 Tax=Pedobacter panaciterrae TaxID=363849 RepID=A0ABU8NM36_9SPHI|nr:response regulator [Pedobacter panaciterrae]NQX52920.1 response regulator [Pedobacter panaciterrae]